MMNWKVPLGAVTAALMICPIAGADGRIQSLVQEEKTEITLTFDTRVDWSYTVQCTTNLIGATWVDVGEAIIAVTNVTTKTVSSPSANCYFRIVESEPAGSGPTEPTDPPPMPSEPTGPTDPGAPPSTPF